ncbi:MAG: hypothetical protein IT378_03725 [Sandaracinaceae bacterium]|nr:hypothetical protein [Sandaracinaceae bacterium]
MRAEVSQAARQCYQQNGAHGAVSVQVALGYDGRVTSSRVVNNGTGNSEVARCISGAMVGRRITAPVPRSGLSLVIPFNG